MKSLDQELAEVTKFTTDVTRYPPDFCHARVRDMLRIRRLEERCAELYGAGKIRGFLHLYIGEEAVAAGVMPHLRPEDNVVATYREHGQALLRGVSMNAIMAEMYAKREGCSRGRGGSMHLFDRATRFFGGNAIVGGGLPLACGLALADQQLPRGNAVTACFFGEGAVAEGVFHESLNLASLWRLPVLFLCENNLYAMGTALARSESETDLVAKAAVYRIEAAHCNGMDVLAVDAAAARAVDYVRQERAPYFLELHTYRFRAHSMFDTGVVPCQGRGRGLEGARPDPHVHAAIEGGEHADRSAVPGARSGRDAGGRRGRGLRRSGKLGAGRGSHEGCSNTAPTRSGSAIRRAAMSARATSYREALREAHREALRRDSRVFIMGEDVGKYGGSYAVTKGFYDEFGPERIRDTPLSELAFVGTGIGAALGGLRPIVEIMTVNFSLLALDQIVNTAATVRHMSGGQFSVPLVIRMATGAGRQLAAQHSHSLEVWYAHIPGIRVLAPATIADARGMLWPALEDPDPVVMFEHAQLYNLEGELSEAAPVVDIERAAVRRAGKDLTIVTYGGSLPRVDEAAAALARQGIDAEVIDLRVLRPLDWGTLVASLRKTHRVLVVDEGWCTCSLAAEIMAGLAERAFYDLDAPPARVCSEEVPMPYAKHLEDAALPMPPKIIAAASRLCGQPA